VEALVAAVNAYQGGVVLISHDARLICSTRCELWVCTGAGADKSGRGSGLRVESRGFEQYRRDVQKELMRQEELAAKRAQARAEARRKARADHLAKARGRTKG
jgi:hypothetical protein